MIHALTIAVVAVVLSLAGCQDPYANDRARPAPAPTQRTAATPGDLARPGPPAGRSPPPADSLSRSPRHAARSFATRWANWDWRTAASQQRALATLAVGDLARQLRANADSARIDASLARDKPGSRGAVAAIDLNADGQRAAGIVVARERTYTDGRADLSGQRYRVYLIGLTYQQNEWAVSAWEPQP